MRRWLWLIGINVAVFAVLLGAAEIVLRVTEPASIDEEIAFAETSARMLEPCTRLEWSGRRAFVVGEESEERLPFRYPRDKDAGVVRIALVGESSGATLGFYLGQLLAASPAKTAFEFLNCAASGSALEHVERRAQEMLGYDPDVLIVVFGHNVDFEYPAEEQLRLLALRRHSRLLGRLADVFTAGASATEKTPLALRLERFEGWLRNLALQSQSQGVGLVLTTLADNLWVVPRTNLQTSLSPAFLDAVYDFAVDEERGTSIMTRLAAGSDDVLLQFTAGIWEARAGHFLEARRRLRQVLDAEPPAYGPEGQSQGRDRAATAVNEIIRRAAREQGVWLSDVQRSIEALARDGLPGWDVMQDHCHLQPRLFVREARALFDVAQEAAGVMPAARVSLDSEIDLGERVTRLRAILDLLVSNRRARELNAWQIGLAVEGLVRAFPSDGRVAVDEFMPGYADARQRAEIITGIAYGYWNLGETDKAIELNERARAKPFAGPWVQLGLFSLRSGNRQQAEHAFAQAHSLEVRRPDARLFLERVRRSATAASGAGLG